jgi:hypothetical protein
VDFFITFRNHQNCRKFLEITKILTADFLAAAARLLATVAARLLAAAARPPDFLAALVCLPDFPAIARPIS